MAGRCPSTSPARSAEAIVSPDQLAQYLGAHDRFRPECDLAYDNQLMVMLWSSLAGLLGHLRPLPRRHRPGGVRR